MINKLIMSSSCLNLKLCKKHEMVITKQIPVGCRVTIFGGQMCTSMQDLRERGLLYPHVSKKTLIYKKIFFKEEQRQEVCRAHFQACFEESFQEMMEDERSEYNLQLYDAIESLPAWQLHRSFLNTGCRDMDHLREVLYRVRRKPVVQHSLQMF